MFLSLKSDKRMQVKKPRDPERSSGDGPEGEPLRKNSSCFSNIKIFLISECALMLAQGTVGAYLVSATNSGLLSVVDRDPGGQRRVVFVHVADLRWNGTPDRNVPSLQDSTLIPG